MKTNNIDISNLTADDWLQIEMVAKGCVSGTLEEWPKLRRIFNYLGLESRGDMRSGDVQDICRNIVNKSHKKNMKETLDKIKSRKQEVEIKIQEILSDFKQEVLEISDSQASLYNISANKIEIRDINGRDHSQFRIELKIGMIL